MAIFAPNPNSYRRFKAGAFAPSGASWGYDHREVALRVPRSSEDNRRIEHRIAVPTPTPTWCWPPCWRVSTPACSAGVIRGSRCRARRTCRTMRSPCRRAWTGAITLFREGDILPDYLGPRFVGAYAAVRQGESDDYHGQVPDLDYAWYLRAL
jgi:glutamine synthetase